MSEQKPTPSEPLEYAKPPTLPLQPHQRALTFLAFLIGVPFVLLAGGLGVIAIANQAVGGVMGLLVAFVLGFGLFMSLGDPRRRRVALAGGLTGVGVCALLLGACFALLANANFH